MTSPRRYRAAILVNLVVPGAGLILLRREWLGLFVALVFAICLEAALYCVLLSPFFLPFRVQLAAWLGAAVTWTASQMLLRHRLAFLRDPELAAQVERLRQQAGEARKAGNVSEARTLLQLALSVDDENIETNVQWAELLGLMGRSRQARRAWRRVARLGRAFTPVDAACRRWRKHTMGHSGPG